MISQYPPFVVRHVTLDPHIIFNECGPESAGPVGDDPKMQAKRERAAERYVKGMNDRNGFYVKLEKSILEKGIRNPILISAGFIQPIKHKKLPPYMREDSDKILVCHNLGGSRLWIAQKHNIMIPCIVSDFCDMFEGEPILDTDEEIMDLFKDKPKAIRRVVSGLVVSNLPQIHLDDN